MRVSIDELASEREKRHQTSHRDHGKQASGKARFAPATGTTRKIGSDGTTHWQHQKPRDIDHQSRDTSHHKAPLETNERRDGEKGHGRNQTEQGWHPKRHNSRVSIELQVRDKLTFEERQASQ